MNVVIDLASAKFNRTNQYEESAVRFVASCVEMNRNMIISMIQSMPTVDVNYILEAITYQILSNIFGNKSQQELLQLISGGSIFKLKDLLLEEFHDDKAILSVLGRGDLPCNL
jgi:hypothetical protein